MDVVTRNLNCTQANSDRLEADRDELRRFIITAFRNCPTGAGAAWLPLQAFAHDVDAENGTERDWAPFGSGLVPAVLQLATATANRPYDRRAVFAPPVCLFGDEKSPKGARTAAQTNVIAAPVVAVELDAGPSAGLAALEAIIGVATIVVASGGTWTGPDGEEPKLHAYWRLRAPATSAEEIAILRKARGHAALLSGADRSAVPVNHPMRWPGSWHTKGEPKLCRIVGGDADAEIDLIEAAKSLEVAVEAAGLESFDRARTGGKRAGFKTEREWPAAMLADAARLMPNDDLCWEAWNRIGMALWDAAHGSPDGRDALHTWSAKSEKYEPDVCDARWWHWAHSPPNDLGGGTVRFEMWKTDPNYGRRPDMAAYFEEPASRASADRDPITAAVDRLNETNAVVQVGGKALILVERRDHDGEVVDFADVRARKVWFANDRLEIKGKPVSVFDVWMTSSRRRQYSSVVFEPAGAPADVYNLWRGFAVKPDPQASCRLFLTHLRENVCRSDEELYSWLVGWMAQMVQRPNEKPGVAVVLGGGRGVGKSIVGSYLGALCPQNYVQISQADQLVGKHNAHLQKALLIQIEEAVWAGDKAAEGALKHLITSDRRMVEPKFVDAFPVRDCARLLFTSNEPWIVPAGNDERRYTVFDCGEARRGDKRYFGAIMHELANGGAAALLGHLQNVDLSRIDVRTAPSTEALARQKEMTLGSVEAWIRQRLMDEALDFYTAWPREIGCTELFNIYEKSTAKARFPRPVTAPHFGRILNDILKTGSPVYRRNKETVSGRERVYCLPPIDEARRRFESWFGQSVGWDA